MDLLSAISYIKMIAPTQPSRKRRRFCFVTIGASAKFDALIKAALSPPCLRALQRLGYTHLVLQHGIEGGAIYRDFITANQAGSQGRQGLEIVGFDFNKQGLGAEMKAAKGNGDDNIMGVVISHAGARLFFFPPLAKLIPLKRIERVRVDT